MDVVSLPNLKIKLPPVRSFRVLGKFPGVYIEVLLKLMWRNKSNTFKNTSVVF